MSIYKYEYIYFYDNVYDYSIRFSKEYLNDTKLSKILIDHEYIIIKSEKDSSIIGVFFYIII